MQVSPSGGQFKQFIRQPRNPPPGTRRLITAFKNLPRGPTLSHTNAERILTNYCFKRQCSVIHHLRPGLPSYLYFSFFRMTSKHTSQTSRAPHAFYIFTVTYRESQN